jgi:hypothetical protein
MAVVRRLVENAIKTVLNGYGEAAFGLEVHTLPLAFEPCAEVDRSGMVCFRCGEYGHVRYQCMTHKVRMCKIPVCNVPNCRFAHSEAELRTPWEQKCVRVVKQNGTFVTVGCHSRTHTFRRCPVHKDLLIV